ncbi:hypothetical protein QBC36DRAFT_307700 [Triangularia setosa]|uniref:Uncharacterized protein n=1 Tax=Triangularia setosa TaxID=2587417 RepID=A0AAN7A997_9PEZI|nr:hypothetical protein QBC36DRAFT_307700 [Podospora setosa]
MESHFTSLASLAFFLTLASLLPTRSSDYDVTGSHRESTQPGGVYLVAVSLCREECKPPLPGSKGSGTYFQIKKTVQILDHVRLKHARVSEDSASQAFQSKGALALQHHSLPSARVLRLPDGVGKARHPPTHTRTRRQQNKS